jgi:malonate transporter and related proteins
MLITAVAIAPIFAIIVLGHGLRRGGIPSFDFWNQNDKLVYWVLMPALLFQNMSTAAFDADLVGDYAIVILGSFAAAVAFGLGASRLAGYAGPVTSSILQGSARHNTFITLAVAERLYGGEGLALAALAAAMLIPVTNISMVTLMVALVSKARGMQVAAAILKDLARNPLLLAVAVGVAWNLGFDGQPTPVIHDIARILGAAALPIMLMCVGANLRTEDLAVAIGPTTLATLAKLLIFPAAVALLARLVGLTEAQTMVAVIFGAAPTASSAYTLARQLGGDAPLMAAIVTLQTAIAFLSLPATLWLLQTVLFAS